MKPKTRSPVSPLEYYWLVAGQVHYQLSDSHGLQQFQRSLNCILKTEREAFAHVNIAKAQQLLQMRLLNEAFTEAPPADFKITDVFMISISHLGRMSADEFQQGYDALAAEQSKAEGVLETLRAAAAKAPAAAG